MLYPKNSAPLSNEKFRELFKNPSSEYRATPFWAWNCKLDSEDFVWQIEQLKKLGFGGFHMHVRTGLDTPYLSDEFMQVVKDCVEKARSENMLAWLYDEDRWPSGAAGGLVTQNHEYRLRHLLLTRKPYEKDAQGEVTSAGGGRSESDSFAAGRRSETGKFVAKYLVSLNAKGELKSYKQLSQDCEVKDSEFILYAYEESALPSGWYNNQTYADTLNPAAIKEFIKVTHERYAKDFKADFGGVIPAIFTDEPQFSHKDALAFAHENRDITLPWTCDLTQTYNKTYGEDILLKLPELLWELENGEISKTRYNYHDHIAERFAQAFADQCGEWCEENNIMLTGHMMSEPSLESQTRALGEAMRSYRSFQLPGIDMLCDDREFTTAKQAQSAARQYGRPGVLSELYGVTNWDFDFRGHKLQGDWQAALGVSVRVPHLSWASMKGEAKRDYPGTFNYQAPWYKEYPYVEDHFARVNALLTRGEACVKIGVIHPVESYWLHFGARENTQDIRSKMDRNFNNITNWLLNNTLDFDYICESLLPELNKTEEINSKESLKVGKMNYKVIIVPECETLRTSTIERLEKFIALGGRVIFLGESPKYENAVVSERVKKLYNSGIKIAFEKTAVLFALEDFGDIRDIEIKNLGGGRCENFIYNMREEKNEKNENNKYLFIAHSDTPRTVDLPNHWSAQLRIKIRGEYNLELCNTTNGEITQINSDRIEISNGFTQYNAEIWEHDSLLLKLIPANNNITNNANSVNNNSQELKRFNFLKPVDIKLEEPNVLLLDMFEYAVNGGDYKPNSLNEVLRLDNEVRRELKLNLRGGGDPQPYIYKDETTPYKLKLKYILKSKINISGCELALENIKNTKVYLNNSLVENKINGYYVDKSIAKIGLPEIKAGENIIELEIAYGAKTDLEAVYLLGDFSVSVAGINCELGEPIKTLAFGDITRQGLPFYGGNLSYNLEVETTGNSLIIEASYYRGQLIKVFVDGEENKSGVIAYSPYKLKIDGIKPGKHKIELKFFGNRVNTFGQLHRNDRINPWWGPGSWRDSGTYWSWEYKFWEQGILKSPEILDLK